MRTNSAWSPADNPGDAAMLAAWCGGALPAVASWLGSLATIGKGIDPNSRSSLRFKAPGPPVYAVLGAIGLGISGLAWAIGSGKEMGDGEKFGLKQGLPLLFDPLTCLDKLGVFFARGKGPTPAGIAAAAIVIIIDAVGWITPVGIDLGEAYHHEPAIDQSNMPRSTDHVVTRAGVDSGR